MPNAKNAFVRKISPHQGLIRSLCSAYFSDHEDQKDAFQDVLLQLWKSYGTFRGESSLTTWVYRVALRTLVKKAQKSRMITCAYRPEDELVSLPPPESAEVVRFALSQISPSDKALVLLHLEGYRNQEIAEVLGISATNVSTRMNRIRQKMKSIIIQEALWT
jgi:RNA polymerase sigma-70 factor (ECF subfamily)